MKNTISLTCLLALVANEASALEFHVDALRGDDTRSPIEAQSPATPWATISFALHTVTPGHTIRVHQGRYAEAPGTHYDRVRLVSDDGARSVVLAPPPGASGLDVANQDVEVSGLVVEGGVHGIRAEGAHHLRIVNCVAVGQSANAFTVIASDGVSIENSVAASAAGHGLSFVGAPGGLIHNNLIYDNREFGIFLDAGPTVGGAPTLLAFNTIAQNGGTKGGGVRLAGVAAELRDSLIVGNAPIGIRIDGPDVRIHSSDLYGSPTPLLPPESPLGEGMISVDPRFRAPSGADGLLGAIAGHRDDDFSLTQDGDDPSSASRAVDAGSMAAAEMGMGGSTASDGRPDQGVADFGYHEGAVPLQRRLVPSPTLAAVGEGARYYVDCMSGDDARGKLDALDPSTPWRSFGRAARDLRRGEVAVALPGVCSETISTRWPGTAFLAQQPGTVDVVPPDGGTGILVQHGDSLVDGFRVLSARQGVLAAASDSSGSIRGIRLRRLTVDRPPGGSLATNGIQVRDADAVTVEGCVVRGADQQGILLKRVRSGFVFNNLVHRVGDWGISFDGDSPSQFATASGNVAAFNTVWGSPRGIRFRNAGGEIRDNVVSENASVGIKYDQPDAEFAVHHNDVWGSATNLDLPSGLRPSVTNWSVDPGLTGPAVGAFRLRQIEGEEPPSPLLDQGSEVAAPRPDGSTATDGRPDVGPVDPGYHADAHPCAAEPGGPGPSGWLPRSATSTPTPGATPVPSVASTHEYWVDPEGGDDRRAPGDAETASTAWRSLGRALASARSGDVVRLRPGVYEQAADFNSDGVTLRGEGLLGEVVIRPPKGEAGVYVDGFSDAHVENLAIEGASQGIVARGSSGLRIRDVAVVDSLSNAIVVRDSTDVWIQNSVIASSGAMGIKIVRSAPAYVRNNLVYDNRDWGISLDDTVDGDTSVPTRGNVIAFNTLHANFRGVRLLAASGEVRDNSITGHEDIGLYVAAPDVTIHHNDFASNRRDRDSKGDYRGSIWAWANLGAHPRFLDPDGADGILGGAGWLDDDFRLESMAAGDSHQSPLLDSGSGAVWDRDIDGVTTRDAAPDVGVADIGFHLGSDVAVRIPPADPPSQNQRVFYVDAARGSDDRSTTEARRSQTPWRTITRALAGMRAGDAVRVAAGTYAESVQVKKADVLIEGQEPGAVILRAPSENGVTIEAPGVTLDGLVIESPRTGVSILASQATRVRRCAVVSSGVDGIRAVDSSGLVIEDSIVTGCAGMGIRFKRSDAAVIRNNLVYGNTEWGVSLEGQSGSPSTDHLVAENTLAWNATGNLRALEATGSARDNLFVGPAATGARISPGFVLAHNGFHANGRHVDPPEVLLFCTGCVGNSVVDPSYAAPAGPDQQLGSAGWRDDDLRLADSSACVDAGSELASVLGVTGSAVESGSLDEGWLDLGFHYVSPLGPLVDPGR